MCKISDKMDKYVALINRGLERYLDNNTDDLVTPAMRYSLMSSGKRIRPILTLAMCEACGGNIKKAIPYACAIEMVHCYSLIHDDLPCMDDDDLRRGIPTCHKKFSESTALLAGDALLTQAFLIVCNACENDNMDSVNGLKAITTIAKLAGVDGMIGGQAMDLANEHKEIDIDILSKTHLLKTSALIMAACYLGVLASCNITSIRETNALRYGQHLGLAFQIIDDILDVTGNEKELGKSTGSDAKSCKVTYMTLLDIEKAKKLAEDNTNIALKSLEVFDNNEFLVGFTKILSDRKK